MPPIDLDLDTRVEIASRLARRCNNCYRQLEGWDVHGPGWNWITSNLGPFCDECMKEVPSRDWRPIDTAPKDGTKIDICAKTWLPAYDRFEYVRFVDCWWRNDDSYGGRAAWVGLGREWCSVYWSMPLPLPEVSDGR